MLNGRFNNLWAIFRSNNAAMDDWNEEKILKYAREIIENPQIQWHQITGQDDILFRPLKYIADAEIGGKRLRVVFEPDDRGILAAYFIE